MSFVWKQECLLESIGEIGFECTDLVARELLMVISAASKARELGAIAAMRDHQAATANQPGNLAGPPFQTFFAQLGDQRLRCLTFAPRGQHAARVPRATA